ncbi:sugar kinase [Streptomyces shenzhenensis]|uniref:sugar kinase n=1 Tax=Streptomyces shenzhenensis TaxID=943815 RepID=UPI003D9449A4
MTDTGSRTDPDVVDVVALGESMVTFLPTRTGRLADVPSFDRAIGGAESNVVCVLAAAGHATRWVSRVGADGFGDHLVAAIGEYGVDVASVRRDPARPTGIYFRTAGDRAGDDHEVAYYRAGSAASAMTVDNVDPAALRAARVLHLSGITAALSDGCLDLLRALTASRPGRRPLVSFDVNFRPGLWRDAAAPRVLLDLARGCDLVFVGADEAEAAWGVPADPDAIRALLPEPRVLVVKEGARGATVFERATAHGALAAHDAGRAGAANGADAAGVASGVGVASGADAAGAANGADAVGVANGADTAGGVGAAGVANAADAAGAANRAGIANGAGDVGDTGGVPGVDGAGGAWDAAGPAWDGPGRTGAAPGRAAAPGPGPDTRTSVPALCVDVVAPVGAGDAFAAGFLSATLRGLPVRDRIRSGHLMAAAALTVPGDLAVPPSRDHADRLLALDDTAWGRLRLGPGWTHAAGQADEEVPTP